MGGGKKVCFVLAGEKMFALGQVGKKMLAFVLGKKKKFAQKEKP